MSLLDTLKLLVEKQPPRRWTEVTGRITEIIPAMYEAPARLTLVESSGRRVLLRDRGRLRRLQVGDTATVKGDNDVTLSNGMIYLQYCRVIRHTRPKPIKPKILEW